MKTSITVQIGDITKQTDCEGIVNSANANLRAGSGVCGAIHSAAGPELEEFSHALSPLEIGHGVITPGFRLPNRVVIHVRGPKYHFDTSPPEQLMSALESALLLADQEKVIRLAVPAISMGVYAYPPEEAVPLLVKTALSLSPRLMWLEEIRFVVVNKALQHLFQESIDKASNPLHTPNNDQPSGCGIPEFLRKYPD